MLQLIDQVSDEVRSAWRFRWAAMGLAATVAVVGWAAVFALPDRYEANARVFVDTHTALKPVLQGLTVEQDVNAQLNFVRQSLLAGPQLQKIAEQSGVLTAAVVDPREQAKILEDLSRRIELTVRSASDRETERDAAGSIYDISYLDGNRARSLKVVSTLLNTLVEQTLGGKRVGSENAQKFLETQIKDYEQRLRAAEDKLAAFKKANIGLMPTEQGGYFAQLQAELDAARKTETALATASTRRAELERQIRGETVVAAAASGGPVLGSAGLTSGSDTLSRIKETQARLDELLLRFTDKHPDVIAARQTLAELQTRRAAEIENLRRGDANALATSGASSNPVFQSIQLALNQADVEIAALRSELAQHHAKAAELRARLDTAPQIEAEFAQLNRDYDVNKAQYTALLANYQKAQLGEQADNAGSVRFDIVQPPLASFQPVWPKRPLLLAGVLAAALALGGGLAYLLHLLRPVVGSARNLSELTGLVVLGVVGAAFPDLQRAGARREVLTFAAIAGSLLVAFVAVLVLNRVGMRLTLNRFGGG